MADGPPLPSNHESTSRDCYHQQEIIFATKRPSLKDSALLTSPERALLQPQNLYPSSASLGDSTSSSMLRPMPPSGPAPGKYRPNFRRQGRTQTKSDAGSLLAAAYTLNESPPEAVDAELPERSSGCLSNALLPRARARQRQRFFGPALAWSYRQQRDMSRTLDFSDLLRQPPTPDEREEDSDSDASSIGSDLESDNDPEAMSMRDLLRSKGSAG
eukprot:TRINITY_DN5116_c0_g1_i11.p1 TRINITY_DN5116_c0_g1~~TRINITY_DN5116_c0_g1_i11.p1  ORF type:complete len:215 (+),score=34.23 TRINITY_DN5116_c0_g1_i11:72-716(+)